MISIMIMSHDNHEMLNECLHRVRAFTPVEHDIVLVDDASEPPYEYSDMAIVRMPSRSDCCALRNAGMAMSKTDIVIWLDNDCMVSENWYVPLLETMEDPTVGLAGQNIDSRLIRKPFFPLNQSDCMIEYQFAYDYNHKNNECDFITSYCVAVRKDAYRPTHCYNMPTPCLDPELGCVVKVNGYKVRVCGKLNVNHIGTGTERPNGREYLFHLAENFAKWYRFWEPHKEKIWELYSGREVIFNHNANESARELSRNQHGAVDEGESIHE
jgi:O-antigen biosynthesis protein